MGPKPRRRYAESPPASGMMEPNSAKENAPKMERIAPMIHAAKTTETLRPSRAISAGFRKIPVPIMVPTTMAADAHAPSPRTSSRRFSVNSTSPSSARARYIVPLRPCNSAHKPADKKRYDRANHGVPRKRHLRSPINVEIEYSRRGTIYRARADEGEV